MQVRVTFLRFNYFTDHPNIYLYVIRGTEKHIRYLLSRKKCYITFWEAADKNKFYDISLDKKTRIVLRAVLVSQKLRQYKTHYNDNSGVIETATC